MAFGGGKVPGVKHAATRGGIRHGSVRHSGGAGGARHRRTFHKVRIRRR